MDSAVPYGGEFRMMPEMSRPEAIAIWRNGRVPVVFKPDKSAPILVRVPFTSSNREWLLGSGRLISWLEKYSAWELPVSRFAAIVGLALARYGSVYLIQAFRRLQKCAPACWNAKGPDCECSCMGENHASGHTLEYEVSDTFAFEWGERKLACRLLTRKGGLGMPYLSHGDHSRRADAPMQPLRPQVAQAQSGRAAAVSEVPERVVEQRAHAQDRKGAAGEAPRIACGPLEAA
jgi:hypothetical protein